MSYFCLILTRNKEMLSAESRYAKCHVSFLIVLNVIMCIIYCYAKCHYAECRYAKCHV